MLRLQGQSEPIDYTVGGGEKERSVRLGRRENAYDRVDREALWNVLKIYGVGGQLMKVIKVFYREENACVKVDCELRDSETGMCNVAVVA